MIVLPSAEVLARVLYVDVGNAVPSSRSNIRDAQSILPVDKIQKYT
jgi:hypothetical protein